MEEEKRLSKALAAAGVGSRRACEALIFAGKVFVNDKCVRAPQTRVVWGKDAIRVNQKNIFKEDTKVYYILNKPKGYMCSHQHYKSKRRIYDLFEKSPFRLFSVGRLDRDTTGLLIVTNDGHFSQKVIHPSSNIAKEYLVKVNETVTDAHLKCISRGGFVEGKFVKPVRVKKVRRGTLKVVVMEGKKREVRRFVEKARLTIEELKRIRIGNLVLGPLQEGQYRAMTESDKKALFDLTKDLTRRDTT